MITKHSPPTSSGEIASKIAHQSLYAAQLLLETKQVARHKMIIVLFCAVFVLIGARLVHLGFSEVARKTELTGQQLFARPDIVDRNGILIATDVPVASLFAEPDRIIDTDEAVEGLISAIAGLGFEETLKKLRSNSGFVWVKRKLSAGEEQRVRRLGIPATGFRREVSRFYPHGRLFSHVIGLTNIDNEGISGLELWIDRQGYNALKMAGMSTGNAKPVSVSMDVRVQYALHTELSKALSEFQASATAGLVLNIETGEVIAIVSLPDFDPNYPTESRDEEKLNRITGSAAELGSVIKTFTTAMTLDSIGAPLSKKFDASKPIMVGRQKVSDPHGKYRQLSIEEIFIYSSNIGSAQEVISVGRDKHFDFLKRAGLLNRLETELPETARPLVPRVWSQASSITASFGHGFATTPLQAAAGIAGVLHDGRVVKPTFVRKSSFDSTDERDLISKETSRKIRHLYRQNVLRGSGRMADVPGYRVGGKTGTAEKIVNGRYAKDQNYNTFAGAFPMEDPRYLVFVVIDNPRKRLNGRSPSGATSAAPTVGAIIRRIATMLNVEPKFHTEPSLLQ